MSENEKQDRCTRYTRQTIKDTFLELSVKTIIIITWNQLPKFLCNTLWISQQTGYCTFPHPFPQTAIFISIFTPSFFFLNNKNYI